VRRTGRAGKDGQGATITAVVDDVGLNVRQLPGVKQSLKQIGARAIGDEDEAVGVCRGHGRIDDCLEIAYIP
jgi:hypothetical protein